MPGWLRSVGSGPLMWMLSNATSTAWISQHQRKGRQGEDDAAQTANVATEKRNENQSDQRIRGRPGQGPALLYAGTGLCQEGRFQSGPISLADRGLARGAEFTMPPTDVTGSTIATLNDTCGNLIQLTRLARYSR